MSKMTNCRVCGQRCEKNEGGAGWIGLLFGFPSIPTVCCDECKQKWLGGRAWFGRRWRQQVILMLVLIAILFIFYLVVSRG